MRIIILVFVFILTFIISFPKDKVYYFMLKSLSSYDIQVDTFSKDISVFGIDMKKNNIYMSKAKVAYAEKIDIGLFSINLNNIKFNGTFKEMIPSIDNINIYIKPGKFLDIIGQFGSIMGSVDILDRKVVFKANITSKIYKKYNNIFMLFKKNKDIKGEYIYAINF